MLQLSVALCVSERNLDVTITFMVPNNADGIGNNENNMSCEVWNAAVT